MIGRKQFDETRALDAAMTAFWQHGFEATSVQDLEQVTGLSKSSLYNAYGSKEELFTRCIERYSVLYSQRLQKELDHPDFRAAIGGFFGRLLNRLEDDAVPNGCLATMAAMEFGASAGVVGRRVEAHLDWMHDAFRRRCARAIEDGQLPRDRDADSLAAMILAMTRGVAVLNRGHSDPALVRDAIKGMLAALDA